MKKNGIINSDISKVLSYMRHTDLICISDLGLPCPENIKTIDLSLKLGYPSFIEVLSEIIKDIKIEHIILAEEIKDNNKKIYNKIPQILIIFLILSKIVKEHCLSTPREVSSCLNTM